MRKKLWVKRTLCAACALAMLLQTGGCANQKKQKEKVLSVVAEQQLEQEVREAAEYVMKKERGLKVDVQILSGDEEKREAEVSRLRTEMMAGKGPDVFILQNYRTRISASDFQLFENPYKIMESGALVSLDKYMEKDTYWEKGCTYKKEFLDAGKYDGRQYILPLSCSYNVLAMNQEEGMKGNTLAEWLEEVKNSPDEAGRGILNDLWLYQEFWFAPGADYEGQKVLFDKEKWQKFAAGYLDVYYETGGQGESSLVDVGMDCMKLSGPVKQIQTVPDIEGKKMAAIATFGAVSASCKEKEEAYQFLMLFLNDELKVEKAKEDKFTQIDGYIDIMNVPVQESAFETWISDKVAEENQEMLLESFRELEGAFFVTDAEREMASSMEGILFPGQNAETEKNVYESRVSETAGKVWEKYKIQVTE